MFAGGGMTNDSLSGTLLPDEAAVARRWSFGSIVVDERSRQVVVDGVPVAVEPRPLHVLLYLLHHAGEVVTKDELAENLWPGRIITDTVLARCISALRHALNDQAKTLVRTVHGYGYRLVAEDLKIDAAPPLAIASFQFKPGDTPRHRPQWRLVEPLGTGGHGEAWLARHDKTQETRVFKFARDERALPSLKREITLYRLLNDSLGERAAVVKILEWNLEEPPYFIESEHVVNGNLRTWADAQGGLRNVRIATRLELVAQIAEALAAAHSVGVLHKDLKPANVLIGVDGGVKLGDFGSGGVVDPQRLEALGITRLGFTRTMAETAAGTPLYLAPEVIAGQPFTVQADVYSLGVLLYQVVVGDLSKALAPGWELDVDDELVRQDIATSAAGNPIRRLAGAGELARRLRTVEIRRLEQAASREAEHRAHKAALAQRELRRARIVASTLLLLATIATGTSLVAYRAKNDAVAATATAKAISDFLTEDVLRIDPALERPKDASYETLLNRAAAKAHTTLAHQPEAAAKVHWLLGRRFHEIGRIEGAAEQYERAAVLAKQLYGATAESTLLPLERLSWIYSAREADRALALSGELRTHSASQAQGNDLALLTLRARIASTLVRIGLVGDGRDELKRIVGEIETADDITEEKRQLVGQLLGVLLSSDVSSLRTHKTTVAVVKAYVEALYVGYYLLPYTEDFVEAERLSRNALVTFNAAFQKPNELSAMSYMTLGYSQIGLGKLGEADTTMQLAQQAYGSLLPSTHFATGVVLAGVGRLRLEQQRGHEAVRLLTQALSTCSGHNGCPQNNRAWLEELLGEAMLLEGRPREAIKQLTAASLGIKELLGTENCQYVRKRILLADAYRAAGEIEKAAEILTGLTPAALRTIRLLPSVMASRKRTLGLIAFRSGAYAEATALLWDARQLLADKLGSSHWRTVRTAKELAAAQAALAASQASNSSGGSAGVKR